MKNPSNPMSGTMALVLSMHLAPLTPQERLRMRRTKRYDAIAAIRLRDKLRLYAWSRQQLTVSETP